MKRVIQVDEWLLVPQSTGWQAVTCAGVTGLLSALSHAFPRRTNLELWIEHEGLEAQTMTAGVRSWDAIRAAAEEQAPDRTHSRTACFLEPTVRSVGDDFGATLWTERQPVIPMLAELLPARNGQTLEAAFPLAFALVRPSTAAGRADLSCLILPDRLVVVGCDPNGQPCRLRLPRSRGEAGDVELRDAIARHGAVVDSRAGVPARFRVISFEGIPEGDDERALRRCFAPLNHFEMLQLRGRRAAAELRFSRPTLSLVPRAAGWGRNRLLRVAQMVAAALAIGAGIHGHVTTHALRTHAARVGREAGEAAEAVKKTERASVELARLERLYGKDAGWGDALPRGFIASLDNLVPSDFSLDLVEWNSNDGLRFEAVHWGEANKLEGPAGDAVCKGLLKTSAPFAGKGSLLIDQTSGKLRFESGRATGS
jgi:hypothetical protein